MVMLYRHIVIGQHIAAWFIDEMILDLVRRPCTVFPVSPDSRQTIRLDHVYSNMI